MTISAHATVFNPNKAGLKKSEKMMKIVNIDGENLHIFWTTWGI